MADYSGYYIKDLLEAIEEGCQKIGEKRDYVKYLLSMEQAESVEILIEIYDNIYKLLFVFTYGYTFPHDWYKPESGGYYKSHLVELLNRYFNDNIERLSKESGYLSREMLAFFIANLRECINAGIVQSKMMEKRLDEEKAVFLEIGNAGKTQYKARKGIESMSKMDRRYEPAIKIYNRFSTLLALKGRIFDVSEIAFAKDNGINYDTLIEQYKEEEERRKKEIEEQKLEEEKELEEERRKEKRQNITMVMIATAINIACGAILYYCFEKDISILLLIWGIMVIAASCFFGIQYLIDNNRKKRGVISYESANESIAGSCLILFALCPYLFVLILSIFGKIGFIGFIIIIGIIGSLPKLFLTG